MAIGTVAAAQPANFIDLGSFTPPAAPEYALDYISSGEYPPFDDPPQSLTVQWFRIQPLIAIQGEFYLDVDVRRYTEGRLSFGVYNNAGNLITTDETDGSFPYFDSPGLSFGSTRVRVPYSGPATPGGDGNLAAGVYWIALAAGSLAEVSFGSSGWNVSTPNAYPIGFDEGQSFFEFSVSTGNTVPFPVPANDLCENATVIGEDSGDTPAWIGSNFGASQEGDSPCYSTSNPGMTYKDVWLSYIPSTDGWAQAVLTNTEGRVPPGLLTRYEGGCGSSPIRCAGGSSFLSPVGTRLVFPITAGQPILLAASVWAGDWAPLVLNIDLIDPFCDVQHPAGAIPEIDAFCGDAANDGCEGGPGTYDTIQVGETIRGSLFNTYTTRDYDFYRLELTQPTLLDLTIRSQLPVQFGIQRLNASTGCPSGTLVSASSLFYPDVCQPLIINYGLDPGSYVIRVQNAALDNFDCSVGSGEYSLTLVNRNCPGPRYTRQPETIRSCENESASLSVVAVADAAITYAWEWGLANSSGTIVWRALPDGVFSAAGSNAMVTGATTPTVTLSGLDAAANVLIRAAARTCSVSPSRPALLEVDPAGSCPPACPADFNADGFLDFFDYADFVSCFEGDACNNPDPLAADFNRDGFVDFFDYADYVLAFETGC
jgi:hypothetical protein